MDVDTDNFEQALVDMEKHLPHATFVALDLEMTGITGTPDTQVCAGDVPQIQYSKARAVVGRPLNIVQVGLCLFEEKTPGCFQCRPYNIYVFPRPVSERDANGCQVKADPFIGLSTSSAIFLAENGMDFQRWITKGVSYTTRVVEQALLSAMPSSAKAPSSTENKDAPGNTKEIPEPTKESDINFVDETLKQVDEFAKSGQKEMKLPNMNSFLALIIRRRIEQSHPDFVVEKRSNPVNHSWQERWVLNLSDDGRRERNTEIRRRLLAHMGFRRMWELVKSCKRPLIVHNGFYDLLFSVSAFECPLPQKLSEFKSTVSKAFPLLFDTKVLAESKELSGVLGTRSALPELASQLDQKLASSSGRAVVPEAEDVSVVDASSEKETAVVGQATNGQQAEVAAVTAEADPVVVAADDASRAGKTNGKGNGNGNGGKASEDDVEVSFIIPEGFEACSSAQSSFHNAGFDAYQTGRVFAYYRAKLGDLRLQDFVNRVFLMFSAFELHLGDVADVLMLNGIARYLYKVNTSLVNNRTLGELMKPLTLDGKRRVVFKWCDENKALILILHGHDDTQIGAPGREDCEQCLDDILKKQDEQGRLKWCLLEEHLEKVASGSTEKNQGGRKNTSESRTNASESGPESKKRKTQ